MGCFGGLSGPTVPSRNAGKILKVFGVGGRNVSFRGRSASRDWTPPPIEEARAFGLKFRPLFPVPASRATASEVGGIR